MGVTRFEHTEEKLLLAAVKFCLFTLPLTLHFCWDASYKSRACPQSSNKYPHTTLSGLVAIFPGILPESLCFTSLNMVLYKFKIYLIMLELCHVTQRNRHLVTVTCRDCWSFAQGAGPRWSGRRGNRHHSHLCCAVILVVTVFRRLQLEHGIICVQGCPWGDHRWAHGTRAKASGQWVGGCHLYQRPFPSFPQPLNTVCGKAPDHCSYLPLSREDPLEGLFLFCFGLGFWYFEAESCL